MTNDKPPAPVEGFYAMLRWMPVEGFEGVEVSSRGDVGKNKMLVKKYTNDKGYQKVSLFGKSVSVHRLVAMAFIPNPNDYPEVNHIDGDKSNNDVSNLEWCNRSQNMKHAYAIGKHPGVSLSGSDNAMYGRRGAAHKQSMRVIATWPDGRCSIYESQLEAERDGFISNKISACINGARKTHKGATWTPLPPTTPPLPSVFTDLGAALEKIKGAE
jgi:hypothetical protein